MTIIFYFSDGSHKVLKPGQHINIAVIETLKNDFRALRYEIK